jgi:DNA invertase Pin-like site-specific DNA recombinase
MARPKVTTREQEEEIKRLLLEPKNTIVGVARAVGISRATMYRLYNANRWDRWINYKAKGGYWYHKVMKQSSPRAMGVS